MTTKQGYVNISSMEKQGKSKLEHIRHSLAHLLAAAVLKLYPKTKNTIGPAIENGFYYDFDFSSPISDKDLPKIEKKMRQILKTWETFAEIKITHSEAKKIYSGNPYKLELISELESEKESITLYYSGPKEKIPDKETLLQTTNYKLPTGFIDLCRGGHVENMKEIDREAFKLSHIAGAYWRGDEKNKMLTRIYGLAFDTKEELDEYIKQQEEAKKRDHKKLGKELGLFIFSPLIGSGLPLFTPKGTIIRNELEHFIDELNKEYGYQNVWIPHIAKPELYKISGHWDKFKKDLFHVKGVKDEFVIKPMNCPHHTQIYASQPRSYRDLPIRYYETTTVYRDEQSGELGGLVRVRSITQDDGHVFLRPDQIEEEFDIILSMQEKILKAVHLTDYRLSLSLRDPKKKKAYLGDDATWEHAQKTMARILKKKKIDFKEIEGEAAFYGPKIDLIVKDNLGREWQLSTIQLDFNMPERFGLEYTDKDNKKKTPVMIHRAFMGSTERFISVLIEHFAGAFPVWLSPLQVVILPISEENQGSYAQEVEKSLKEAGYRVEYRGEGESLSKRIRGAQLEKIPYTVVIGEKEQKGGTITVEGRGDERYPNIKIDEFIKLLKEKVENKS